MYFEHFYFQGLIYEKLLCFDINLNLIMFTSIIYYIFYIYIINLYIYNKNKLHLYVLRAILPSLKIIPDVFDEGEFNINIYEYEYVPL